MDNYLDREGGEAQISASDTGCWRTEEARLESEQRYRLLVEMMPGIVYRTAVNEGGLSYISPRIEAVLGFSADQWVDDPGLWSSRIHRHDRERVMTRLTEARQRGRPYVNEYRMLAHSGRIVWFRDEGLPVLNANGRVQFFLGLLQDITEHRQAELEMREWHDEVEHLMGLQVATQTAAALAHELNQPLNAIASYNAAALRLLQAGNSQPDRLRHAIEHSVEQVERAGRVMRDLLALLHKGETVTEEVCLNRAVREAVVILESDGYIDGVKAILQLDPELSLVRANRLQVQKVLVNLLRNAVEAIRGADLPDGVVSVRTEVVDGMAQVSVEDNGPGIEAGQIKRIFEPFYTTKQEGIGMGLAISQSLIKAHGGSLWCESGEGHGAIFHFTLPLAD